MLIIHCTCYTDCKVDSTFPRCPPVVRPVADDAIFVPPGMKHEFFNQTEEPVEFVLLMFGEGA